jgi:preprotein translocase subunit SecF
MRRVIDFLRLRWVFFIFSTLLILAGVVGYFALGGFNLGIDFTAGLVEQVRVDPAVRKTSIGEVRDAVASIGKFDVQVVGPADQQVYAIKVLAPGEDPAFQNETENRLTQLLTARFGEGDFQIQSSDFVGPRYSRELASQTISILLVAVILILIYAAVRFQFIYGMAAVICLVHDALFMLSVVVIFRFEFTTTTVAAILTIIGYSINDTIVIFDRVRENRGLMRDSSLINILNTSITQTLSRTILTSLTTLVAILALAIVTSGDIERFALLMILGIAEGTYSTIFVASPIVLEWTRGVERRRKRRDIERYGRPVGAGLPRSEAELAAVREPVRQRVAADELEGTGAREEIVRAPAEPPARPAEAPHRGGPVQVTRTQPSRKKKKKKH